MATYNLSAGPPPDRGAYAKQLAAGVVDTVNFPRDINRVEIISDGTSAIYVTLDGTAPTVGGSATYEIPAGGGAVREIIEPTLGNTVVKLISAGTPRYSVAEVSS